MKNLFTFQNTLLFFSKVHPLGTYRMNFDAKITALLFCSAFFFNTTSFAQSSTCIPGNVENAGESSWSEECYLNDECLEQGNPCQANDVKMLGAYIADLSGGPINTFISGQLKHRWGIINDINCKIYRR